MGDVVMTNVICDETVKKIATRLGELLEDYKSGRLKDDFLEVFTLLNLPVFYLDKEGKETSEEEFYSLKEENDVARFCYVPDRRVVYCAWEENYK